MKRIKSFIILTLMAFPVASIAQMPDKVEPPFDVGEELTYKVKYGFIPCATASISVEKSSRKFDGEPAYRLVGTGKTVSAARLIVKVHNRYDSYINPNSLKPYLFTETVKEGDYRRNGYARFDHDNKVVNTNKGVYDIKKNTFDVLSAFYYARSLDVSTMKKGDTFELTYFIDDELYPLTIKYLGKETIRTDFGKMECLKFTPSLIEGRIFRDDSDMYLWISNDANRVPVKAKVEILIGSLTLELQDYQNLKYPLGTPITTAMR